MNELEIRLHDALRDPNRNREAPTSDEVMSGVRARMNTPPPAEKWLRSRSELMPMLVAAAGVLAIMFGAVTVSGWDVNSDVSNKPTEGADRREDNSAASSEPPDGAAGDWRAIAQSPLEPRSDAVTAWTGSEMIVFGGTTWPPCPPNASCAGPDLDSLSRDGAAYDPVADSWRLLAEAPQPILDATAVWTGSELVVLVDEYKKLPAATLVYDPGSNQWRELPAPPGPIGYVPGGAWTGQQVVFWQMEERRSLDDWMLDPAAGTWTQLPSDPYPATFDRSYTWVGDRLVFTALLSSAVDSAAPGYYQVADYDVATEAWHVREESPVGFWDPNWFFHQGQLVNPSQEVDSGGGTPRQHPSPGGAMDPATGQWSAIPQTDVSYQELIASCELPRIGSAGPWLAGGGPILVSLEPADWVKVPSCPQLTQPDVGVWTGSQLIIWGGPNADYRENTNLGLSWQPPPPG